MLKLEEEVKEAKFVLYYGVQDSADEALSNLDGKLMRFDSVDEAITFRESAEINEVHEDSHYWIDNKVSNTYIALDEGQFDEVERYR